MADGEDIRRHSASEPGPTPARGESRSDWARVRGMTEADLEQSVENDPDWKDVPANWHDTALPVRPGPKKLISLRIDEDIVEWFRASGPGYQTWMNAVLRAYVMEQKKRQKAKAP